MDPPAGCVERQLPHGNAHPITSQVAQAQDSLAVRHHDGLEGDARVNKVNDRLVVWLVCVFLWAYFYVVYRPGVEHGGDVTSVMNGDEEPAVKNNHRFGINATDPTLRS